jgi:selenium metabolism protein YedF
MSDEQKKSSIVIQVTNDGMGNAETGLTHKLLQTYLSLLDENNQLPAVISFYTEGVKMVVEGSPVLERLRSLENKGVRLIVCRTCLDYFGLVEKLEVGILSGMTDIVEAQWRAEKVITL